VLHWLTDRRRRHLLEHPFPDAWRAILERDVGAYRLLDADEQQRLRDLVQVFVAEKHWEGAGGLEMTDEVRVTIAGSACLMILGRDHDLFADVASIVVYPDAVVARRPQWQTYTSARPMRDGLPVYGLAQPGGAVVLTWDAIAKGARDPHDGRNLVIHELAHKIDFLDGSADGTPPLDRAGRRAWHDAFEPAFQAHVARAERGEKSLLRDYATTNEAEYFACATEVFFEKPREMREELPEVYAQLASFFGVDPAASAHAPPPKAS
jgi:hypothetical protein